MNGMKVQMTDNLGNVYTFRNVTEVFYGEEDDGRNVVAFESDIHSTGWCRPADTIKLFRVMELETEIADIFIE